MSKLNRLFLSLLTIFTLASCASNQQMLIKYRAELEASNNSKALEIANSEKFLTNPESILLKKIEQGSAHYLNGNYYQALNFFNEAQEISNRLYTISVSNKTKSILGNTESENFSGEYYEQSLIRYYQILSHLKIAEVKKYEAYEFMSKNSEGNSLKVKVEEKLLQESDIKFHKQAAKSVLLEWNSFLEGLKVTNAGEKIYKDELIAKLIGSAIHEKFNNRTDDQIALNLKKQSKQTIFRFYNSYESFNEKYIDFGKNFSEFPKMKEKDIQEKFIAETSLARDLQLYVDNKIQHWNKQRDNVYIIWHQGLISSKKVKNYTFPLDLSKSISAGIALAEKQSFTKFCYSLLRISVGIVPTISFELPYIDYKKANEDFEFIVKHKNGEIAEIQKALLVGPLSEVAHFSLESKKNAMRVEKGTKVALKYISALVSTYASYKSLAKSIGPEAAFAASSIAFAGLTRAIASSEKADIRSWQSLPNQIRFNSFRLEKGQYDIYVKETNGVQEVSIGTLDVAEKDKLELKFL